MLASRKANVGTLGETQREIRPGKGNKTGISQKAREKGCCLLYLRWWSYRSEWALPAVKYMGQLFDHLGYEIMSEWYIVGEFHGKLQHLSTGDVWGTFKGDPMRLTCRRCSRKLSGYSRSEKKENHFHDHFIHREECLAIRSQAGRLWPCRRSDHIGYRQADRGFRCRVAHNTQNISYSPK